jgi:hypothetical protein
MPFICSICGEQSTRICARCTKDACDNHLCEKCLRCSDCCECEVTLSEPTRQVVRVAVKEPESVPEPARAEYPTGDPAPSVEPYPQEPIPQEPLPPEPHLAEPEPAQPEPAALEREPETETEPVPE